MSKPWMQPLSEKVISEIEVNLFLLVVYDGGRKRGY